MTILDVRYSSCNSGYGVRSQDLHKWKPRFYDALATSLDQYCCESDLFPNTLLLDVENGEKDVLLVAEQVIRDSSPNIIMECGDMGRTEETCTRAYLEFLERRGYDFYEFDDVTESLRCHLVKPSYPDRYPNILAVRG